MLDDGVRDRVVDVRAPDVAQVLGGDVRVQADGGPHGECGVGPECGVLGLLFGGEGGDEGVGGAVHV